VVFPRNRGKFVIPVLCVLLSVSIITLASSNVNNRISPRGFDWNNGLVSLDGLWEFYWQQLLEPEDFSVGHPSPTGIVHVPGAWNGYKFQNQPLPGQGYGTYRILIELEKPEELMGITIPRILTAYRLWVNGREVARAGQVGKDLREITPQYLPQQAFFPVKDEPVEIIVQVANFHHRSGGILDSIRLGTVNQVMAQTKKNIAYDLFLFGSLLIMGSYHLILFFFRKTQGPLLYFSLYCLLVSLRTLLVGEILFIQLFPGFNWELAHKIQTLSYYVGTHVIVMFFTTMFPLYSSQNIVRFSSLIVLIFSLLVLFTPARVFTIFNPVFQIFTLALILYIIRLQYKVVKNHQLGALFITVGAAVLFLTVINDLIFLSILMSDHHLLRAFITRGNLSSFGLLVFVFTHSLVIAIEFSLTYDQNEKLTQDLLQLNQALESTVKKRTIALETSKWQIEEKRRQLEEANSRLTLLSQIDPLTNIWNRRYFDERLNLAWNEALRSRCHLSLLFIDMDDFKPFNDKYGHQAGDECLQRVTRLIDQESKRKKGIVARYGGEEFVVLLTGTDSTGAEQVAEAIRYQVETSVIKPAQPGEVTVSIGIASIIPTTQISSTGLTEAADRAMYGAKQKGKNQVNTQTEGPDTIPKIGFQL
jgi:diguanylate cyclase (GGDEF)-like protein